MQFNSSRKLVLGEQMIADTPTLFLFGPFAPGTYIHSVHLSCQAALPGTGSYLYIIPISSPDRTASQIVADNEASDFLTGSAGDMRLAYFGGGDVAMPFHVCHRITQQAPYFAVIVSLTDAQACAVSLNIPPSPGQS